MLLDYWSQRPAGKSSWLLILQPGWAKSYYWSVWCFISNWADPSVSLWSPPSSNFFLWIMLKLNFCCDFFSPRKIIAGLRISQHSKQIISTVQEMRQSAGHSCMTMTAKEGTTRCKIYPINPGSPDLWARLKGFQLKACCVDHNIGRHPLILINEIPTGLRLTLISSSRRDFLSTGSWVSLWLDNETSLHTSVCLVILEGFLLLYWYRCRLIWYLNLKFRMLDGYNLPINVKL